MEEQCIWTEDALRVIDILSPIEYETGERCLRFQLYFAREKWVLITFGGKTQQVPSETDPSMLTTCDHGCSTPCARFV